MGDYPARPDIFDLERPHEAEDQRVQPLVNQFFLNVYGSAEVLNHT